MFDLFLSPYARNVSLYTSIWQLHLFDITVYTFSSFLSLRKVYHKRYLIDWCLRSDKIMHFKLEKHLTEFECEISRGTFDVFHYLLLLLISVSTYTGARTNLISDYTIGRCRLYFLSNESRFLARFLFFFFNFLHLY